MPAIGAEHDFRVYAQKCRIGATGAEHVVTRYCIIKNGTLVPVGNAVVFPASCILTLAKTAQQFAREITLMEMGESIAH